MKTIDNLMTSLSNRERCLLYLEKYADKDLKSVAAMFAEDITLRDWKIYVKGKEQAVAETRTNFENAETIEIEVLSTHESENTVAAELRILVDGTEELFVVDIVTFNADGLITSIRAYKGRGDD